MTITNIKGIVAVPGGASNAIFAHSSYTTDTAGRLFPYVYAGSGANASTHDVGWGIQASLSANVTLEQRFQMPSTIPPGTMKMMLTLIAQASAGNAKIQVNDAVVSAGQAPSGVTLVAETEQTVSWAAAGEDKYQVVKVPLTPTPSGNDTLVVALTFNTSAWTLAKPLCVNNSIIFE